MKALRKGKIVRRFGINIFGQPKFDMLLKRKPHVPGKSPGKVKSVKKSGYRLQLEEKQKFRFSYGVSERQFRNIYLKAKKGDGVTGTRMVELLELRLDNIIYRLGWAASRSQARQMVAHKHFLLNGNSHNIPSSTVSPGDVIAARPGSGIMELIRKNLSGAAALKPSWLESDNDSFTAKIAGTPVPEEIQPAGNVQLVVEYYSRQ